MGQKDSALRILLAHNRYLIGGGERQVFTAEARLLRDHGHFVETHIEDNQRVAQLGRVRTAARTLWSTETYRAIRGKLQNGRFDIVHVHNTFPLISPSIYYAARAERVPLVQTLHNFRLLCVNGLLFRAGRACEDCVGRAIPWPGVVHACYKDSHGGSATVAAMLTLHRAIGTWDRLIDTYIALTAFSRQKLIEGGLPEAKIVIKPNFIAVGAAQDPQPGRGSGEFALFVGRLSAEKGIDTLLAAWRLLGERIPLKIAGDGPQRANVVAAATALPAVEYLGALDHGQVLGLMQDARFLVFPSVWYENFPMVIVEAFATGLPVLASKLGNMSSLVQTRRTGLHFRPGDAADLADQALWLVNHPDELRAMRSAARATYAEQFTPSRNYRLLRNIYRDALARVAHES